jgi:hypothetical protein
VPRDIDRGDQSSIDEERQAVVRTDAEWTALWRRHNPNRARPRVDFAKDMVLAVFLGSRPVAGFSTEIANVAISGDVLVVQYREKRPVGGGVAAQVLTFPFDIVAVPARAGPVRFERID